MRKKRVDFVDRQTELALFAIPAKFKVPVPSTKLPPPTLSSLPPYSNNCAFFVVSDKSLSCVLLPAELALLHKTRMLISLSSPETESQQSETNPQTAT